MYAKDITSHKEILRDDYAANSKKLNKEISQGSKSTTSHKKIFQLPKKYEISSENLSTKEVNLARKSEKYAAKSIKIS
jgi:hypothetical protein